MLEGGGVDRAPVSVRPIIGCRPRGLSLICPRTFSSGLRSGRYGGVSGRWSGPDALLRWSVGKIKYFVYFVVQYLFADPVSIFTVAPAW